MKYPYAVGFVAWSAVSAALALASTLGQLIALRVLPGVFESVAQPASLRWIRFNFPEKNCGLAVGIFMSGRKFGPAIGTPLAAFLIRDYDWRAMFRLLGLGSLLWLIPWFGFVRQNDRDTEKAAVATSPMSFGRTILNPIMLGAYTFFSFGGMAVVAPLAGWGADGSSRGASTPSTGPVTIALHAGYLVLHDSGHRGVLFSGARQILARGRC